MPGQKEKEKFLLKDHLFNRKKVSGLSEELLRAYPDFAAEKFVKDVVAGFKNRELKERIAWMAEMLRKSLPDDYRKALKIILKALPPPLDPSLTDNDFGDFIYAPYGDFVARYGCNERDLAPSLEALRALTQRFSAEDPIRFFLNAFPEETMAQIETWKNDSHYHVRRLCSEGLRPRLPWSQKLMLPVAAGLPVLESLFADPTRYVTRSVANHMNDIAKVDPDLALKTLAAWKKSGKQTADEMEFIVAHSLRGLVKQGHPGAMKLLGFSPDASVSVAFFKVPLRLKRGQTLEFSLGLKASAPVPVLVDYLIHFRNKSGGLNAGKVFKLKKLNLKKGEVQEIRKAHPLPENMTTRTIYPGIHYLELQINGKSYGKKRFEIA
ncbi:MAG: hypothetical protein KDK25_14445 [Leptospiraceae bacterium]|nr:hypothetical protein [Leptospiraceae bacterium]